MKRGSIVFLAVLLVAGTSAANAQYVFVGGGANIPVGDFKTAGAKTGWIAQTGVGYDIGSKGLWVEAEGWFGSNKNSGTAAGKTSFVGGIGAVGYSFMPDKKVSPYVVAGAGFLSAKAKPATGASVKSTKFAYTGGAGLGFKLNSTVLFWVEGRLLGTKNAKMIPISAGFTFNFGKKSM